MSHIIAPTEDPMGRTERERESCLKTVIALFRSCASLGCCWRRAEMGAWTDKAGEKVTGRAGQENHGHCRPYSINHPSMIQSLALDTRLPGNRKAQIRAIPTTTFGQTLDEPVKSSVTWPTVSNCEVGLQKMLPGSMVTRNGLTPAQQARNRQGAWQGKSS